MLQTKEQHIVYLKITAELQAHPATFASLQIEAYRRKQNRRVNRTSLIGSRPRSKAEGEKQCLQPALVQIGFRGSPNRFGSCRDFNIVRIWKQLRQSDAPALEQ